MNKISIRTHHRYLLPLETSCRLIKSHRNTPYLVIHHWSWVTYCPLWPRRLVRRKMPPGVMTVTFLEEFWSGSQRSHRRSELWSGDRVFFHVQWPMGRIHEVIHFTGFRAMVSVINHDVDSGELGSNPIRLFLTWVEHLTSGSTDFFRVIIDRYIQTTTVIWLCACVEWWSHLGCWCRVCPPFSQPFLVKNVSSGGKE